MTRSRYSTCTLAGEGVVPWLACAGELAYSPQSPPERDYFFQYSWVVPGVLRAGSRERRHFWFGGSSKDCPEVRLLFTFWNRARHGEFDALYVSNGMATESVTALMAVYRHPDPSPSARERLIFIQHGSYLIADIKSQPYIDRGEAVSIEVFTMPGCFPSTGCLPRTSGCV